jgi:hypothetical protein
VIGWEEPKAFPLKSGVREGHPLSLLLFIIILEILVREIKRKK